MKRVLGRYICCIGAYQLTKLHVSLGSAEEGGRREHVLSNAVFSISWHDGSVCRRVVWFWFVDVTTTGGLRMFDGPLAGLEGTKGDDNKGECQKQILCEGAVSARP